MVDPEIIRQTIDMVKAEFGNPNSDLLKAFTQSGSAISGLTAYSLEAPAKSLFPVLTPLRNIVPRRTGGRGIQANWRAVTGVNTGAISAGVAEGKRGGVVTTSTADYLAAFKVMGLEDYVTNEAYYAGVGFEDVRALASLNLLKALMIQEEHLILGGNGAAVALGKPTTPTVTNLAGTTGSMKANTKYDVVVVALTLKGMQAASVTGGIVQSSSRTNAGPAGGTTTIYGGSSTVSDAGNVTTTNDGVNTHLIQATTPVVAGAVAYAWFWGPNGGNVALGAITTINSVVISTEAGAGTQFVSALTGGTDYSKNQYVFDGLLYQAWKSASGAYIKNMATGTPGTGTALTADGRGGIVELDDALQSFWDNYRLSPSTFWVSGQEAKNITAKVLTGTATGTQSFQFRIDTAQNQIMGGMVVDSYLNKFGMDGNKIVKIKIHPNLPAGTILIDTDILPYPLSNVAELKQMLLRYDYMQIDWPLTQRQEEYGVYFDGVLQHYFPPALGVITNIGNG
jgi:hypothetical protein